MTKSTSTGLARSKKRSPGRPKGSKNKATLLREEYQSQAMEMIGKDLGRVLQDVMDQAKATRDNEGNITKNGDAQSQKLIWNAFMKGGGLGQGDIEKPDIEITVNVRSLERVLDIEDADYKEIDDG